MKNDNFFYLVLTVGILAIALMQMNAIRYGYNGTLFYSSLSAIGVIVGYVLKKPIEKADLKNHMMELVK